MKIIRIDYDEFKKGTYRGVEVSEPGERPVVFFTGDAGRDFEAALESCGDERVVCSSSVDHFISDDPEAAGGVARLRRPGGL